MKYLFTDIYLDFNCIGSKCVNTCCAGWTITVDNKTYKMYEKLECKQKDWILNNINYNNNGFYEITKKEDGRCPFLNECNLCDIILTLSDEYISDTCKTYPRRMDVYNDMVIGTVVMSCPEVTRLIIEKKEAMQFIFHEDDIKNGEEYSWNLYNQLINGLVTAVDILQDKKLLLEEKYLLLLLMLEEMQVKIDQEQIDNISYIIKKYKNKNERITIVNRLKNIFSMEIDSWKIMQENLFLLIKYKRESNEKITAYTKDALSILTEKKYKEWKKKYKELQLQSEYEKIAIHIIIEYYMDALKGKSLFHVMIKLFLFHLYIEFFQLYIYNITGNLSKEDRIYIIVSISRMFEHSYFLEELTKSYFNHSKANNLIGLLLSIK